MIKLSEKNKIIKNLLAVDISFMLILAAINCVSVIQPVLNQDGGLGLASQSVNFGTAIIGSIVIPSIVCKIFGFKWGMFIGECLILTYVAFQALPKWETLIPSCFLFLPKNKIFINYLNYLQLKLRFFLDLVMQLLVTSMEFM